MNVAVQKLIDESLMIARKNFQGFGFEDAQIEPLLEAGKRDLTRELNTLHNLLNSEPIEVETLNLSLHALKGLLLNMGNMPLADRFNELQSGEETRQVIEDIKALLQV